MKTTLPIKLMILSFLLFVTGCASTSAVHQDMQTIADASQKNTRVQIAKVEAPDNIISEKMMLASMKSGVVTSTAQSIAMALGGGSIKQLGIVGDSEAVNVATLTQALTLLQQKVNVTVYVVGEEGVYEKVKALAMEKGVKLVVLARTKSKNKSAFSQQQATQKESLYDYEKEQFEQRKQQVQQNNYDTLKSMIPSRHS